MIYGFYSAPERKAAKNECNISISSLFENQITFNPAIVMNTNSEHRKLAPTKNEEQKTRSGKCICNVIVKGRENLFR